jgi:hypothetical protein
VTGATWRAASTPANAYYHCGPADQRLDIGHTVPIGEPWLDESACDTWLVEPPYPYGPEFEWCDVPDGHVRVAWLLPITPVGVRYKQQHGLDALEERFERRAADFADPARPGVV